MTNCIKIQDINEIDINNSFFHYTNKNNLKSIIKNGLQPRIGSNSLYVEKSEKVFFAIGKIGILTIMDVWLKWLTSKSCITNSIYRLGNWYMKFPLCIKSIPVFLASHFLSNQNNRKKVYIKMHTILEDSIFLILNLEENIDFDYNDIDEVKDSYYESFLKLLYPKTSNLNNSKMEYWNMHTYSNKTIPYEKIILLKDKNKYSASEIVKNLIEENIDYVRQNFEFLYEYYNYIYLNS